MRSDKHVAVRGAKGVLISADAQPSANGRQLNMDGAVGLLEQAMQPFLVLGDVARGHRLLPLLDDFGAAERHANSEHPACRQQSAKSPAGQQPQEQCR